ncbi:hypothetical protein [Pseudomonas putida]
MDKRTFIGMIDPGELLVQQAIDAMRHYREPEAASWPADEVQRLRLLAESLYQAVLDFQLIKAVGQRLLFID